MLYYIYTHILYYIYTHILYTCFWVFLPIDSKTSNQLLSLHNWVRIFYPFIKLGYSNVFHN